MRGLGRAGLDNDLNRQGLLKTNMGSIEVQEDGSIYIQVADADSVKLFIRKARQAYREAHPDQTRPRGRKSEEPNIRELLSELYSKGQIDSLTTQGEIIRLVKSQLPPPVPHEDTILKFVKKFRLMTAEIKSPELGVFLGRKVLLKDLSPQEDRWLRKRAPSIMKAIDRFEQQRERLYEAGKLGEIVNLEIDPFRSGKPIKMTVQEKHLAPEGQKELTETFQQLMSEIASFHK